MTRDMFSFCNIENLLLDYRARSSICGYGTPGLTENFHFLDVLTGFRKSTVIKDLTKKELPLAQMDFLLIDLIDERFEIYSKNNTIFARSTYLTEASGITHLQAKKAFERGSEEHIGTFEKGARKLLKDCKSNGVKPILHQARWATLTQTENGLVPISNEKKIMDKINRENEILRRLEARLNKLEPQMKIISSQENCVADPNHKWGLQPFHYIQEYYSDIYSQLSLEFHHLGFNSKAC